MTARCYVAGHIAPRSQPARMTVRGVVVEPTRTPIVTTLTPLGRDVQAFCEAWQRGDVEPCPVCGRIACDCDEWHELMNTDPTDPDPHGDLRALQAMEIPL
jgi:hypothetical protein